MTGFYSVADFPVICFCQGSLDETEIFLFMSIEEQLFFVNRSRMDHIRIVLFSFYHYIHFITKKGFQVFVSQQDIPVRPEITIFQFNQVLPGNPEDTLDQAPLDCIFYMKITENLIACIIKVHLCIPIHGLEAYMQYQCLFHALERLSLQSFNKFKVTGLVQKDLNILLHFFISQPVAVPVFH